MAKDKEPPTAQDGFEIFLLSRICKSQERNPKRLFTNVFATVLLFPCGSAMRTPLFVLAVSISLHCQMHLFPELYIAQMLDYVLLRCWLHWRSIFLPIFETNTNFHIDLFIIIDSKVYSYIYIYALEMLDSATVISARDMRA